METEIKRNVFLKRMMYLSVCICFVSCVFGNAAWILALGLVLFLCILYYQRNLSVKISALHIYVLLFTAFIYLSCLWAQDPSRTIPKGNSVFFSFFIILIVAMVFNEDDSTEKLLKCIMYGGYLVVILFVIIYGWSGITKLIADSERPDNELLNANVLGMTAAYSLIINIYLLFVINKRLRITDLLMLPVALIIFVSGSRKALLIVALGILGILLAANIGKKRKDKSFIWIFGVIAAAGAAVLILAQTQAFSEMLKKMGDIFEALGGGGTRLGNSAWLRFRYVELGLSLFAANPLLGVGIGNANLYTMAAYGKDHYLHNNYAELLACGGIIGFALYYSIYVYLIVVFIKYRKYRTREYNLCFILLIIWLIMDVGAVKYYGKTTFLYLMLFWMEAEKLKKKAREAAIENISICRETAA